MPTRQSKLTKRPYDIDGKTLTWHPDQWEGEEPIPDIHLPMRMKVGRLRKLAASVGGEANIMRSNEAMNAVFQFVAPTQMGKVDEMDVNDFQDMFATWIGEYNTLNGTSLGESSASSPSSPSTEAQSNTTGGPASTEA